MDIKYILTQASWYSIMFSWSGQLSWLDQLRPFYLTCCLVQCLGKVNVQALGLISDRHACLSGLNDRQAHDSKRNTGPRYKRHVTRPQWITSSEEQAETCVNKIVWKMQGIRSKFLLSKFATHGTSIMDEHWELWSSTRRFFDDCMLCQIELATQKIRCQRSRCLNHSRDTLGLKLLQSSDELS